MITWYPKQYRTTYKELDDGPALELRVDHFQDIGERAILRARDGRDEIAVVGDDSIRELVAWLIECGYGPK